MRTTIELERNLTLKPEEVKIKMIIEVNQTRTETATTKNKTSQAMLPEPKR